MTVTFYSRPNELLKDIYVVIMINKLGDYENTGTLNI